MNANLRTINLASCNIGAAGALALWHYIKATRAPLEVVDIRDNNVGLGRVVEAMEQAVMQKPSIRAVGFDFSRDALIEASRLVAEVMSPASIAAPTDDPPPPPTPPCVLSREPLLKEGLPVLRTLQVQTDMPHVLMPTLFFPVSVHVSFLPHILMHCPVSVYVSFWPGPREVPSALSLAPRHLGMQHHGSGCACCRLPPPPHICYGFHQSLQQQHHRQRSRSPDDGSRRQRVHRGDCHGWKRLPGSHPDPRGRPQAQHLGVFVSIPHRVV